MKKSLKQAALFLSSDMFSITCEDSGTTDSGGSSSKTSAETITLTILNQSVQQGGLL